MKYYKLSILENNLIWVLVKNSQAIIIDCGDPLPIIEFIKTNNFNLTHVLITHFHEDHVSGIEYIKKYTESKILASKITQEFLDPKLIDIAISNEQKFTINDSLIQPIFTPGHCEDHIMYFFPENKWLFSGDTLFTLGCGRAFFNINILFNSLVKVVKLLPKNTLIFPGHNYLKTNLDFLNSLKFFTLKNKDMFNVALIDIPSQLEVEIQYNPFLNYDNQEFKQLLGKNTLNDLDFFKYLRQLKDTY